MQAARQRRNHHWQATNPSVSPNSHGFESNDINTRKNRKVRAAEQSRIVNTRYLQMRPLDGMDYVLVRKHLDFLRGDFGTRQQRDIVEHDGQTHPVANSAEVVKHILLWRPQEERSDQH